MYHPKIIESRLNSLIEARQVYYEWQGRKILYEPTWHSVAECEASTTHLDDLVDEETSKLKRPLDEAEVAYITNERLLVRLSFDYFSTRYCFIKDQSDRHMRFAPRIPNKIISDICAEHDLKQIAIDLLFLKARQLGVSRDISLRFAHRVLFYSGINAVLASADDQKTAKLAEMLEYPIDHLPWWLAPQPTLRRTGEYLIFGEQGSGISLESGNQFRGIARGTTPTCVHLSEISDYQDAEDLIDASLMRAIHDSPGTFLVLESTALGRANYFHKTWKTTKELWPQGRSRLRPIFLPWFVGTDIYPGESWVRARWDHFCDYKPAQHTLDEAQRAKVFVQENDLLRQYLGEGWEMPKSQQFFWECEYEEHKQKGELNRFLAEMASSDDSAFQSTNISVFSVEDIIHYRTETHKQPPVGVYGLVTNEDIFPKRLQPAQPQIDPNKAKIDIRWTWGTGRPLEFTLEPVLWRGYGADDQGGNGLILLFEMPDGRSEYGIGVDTGDGVGKDRSVNEVIRKGNVFSKSSQTAEYASPYVNSHNLWPITAALTALYAMPRNGRLAQPRVAIECRGNGDTVQHEMIKRGLYNYHPWVRIDSKNINPGRAHKIGVFTNSWFRRQVMDWLIVFLRDRKMDIHSPFLVTEMESLEADEYAQSLKAGYGEHDDRLMALGFIIVSMYQLEIARGQGPEDQTTEQQDDPVWTPPDAGLVAQQQAFLQRMGAKRTRV